MLVVTYMDIERDPDGCMLCCPAVFLYVMKQIGAPMGTDLLFCCFKCTEKERVSLCMQIGNGNSHSFLVDRSSRS